MRELKFRAYIETENKVVDVCTIDFDEGTIGVIDFNLMGCPYLKSWDFDQVKLMQYIGLKDKAGAGIYEGNILEFGYKNGDIRYSAKQARYNIYFKEKFGTTEMNIDLIKMESAKIIGNIYENPELCEVTK